MWLILDVVNNSNRQCHVLNCNPLSEPQLVLLQQLFWRIFVGIITLPIYRDFIFVNFSFIGMLSSRTVVLDAERYRHKKEKIVVNEFGICTENYLDCVSFLPPTGYSELTTQQSQSSNCMSRNLGHRFGHGFDWDIGNYPFFNFTQIIRSVRLRDPGAVIYAKGTENVLCQSCKSALLLIWIHLNVHRYL